VMPLQGIGSRIIRLNRPVKRNTAYYFKGAETLLDILLGFTRYTEVHHGRTFTYTSQHPRASRITQTAQATVFTCEQVGFQNAREGQAKVIGLQSFCEIKSTAAASRLR